MDKDHPEAHLTGDLHNVLIVVKWVINNVLAQNVVEDPLDDPQVDFLHVLILAHHTVLTAPIPLEVPKDLGKEEKEILQAKDLAKETDVMTTDVPPGALDVVVSVLVLFLQILLDEVIVVLMIQDDVISLVGTVLATVMTENMAKDMVKVKAKEDPQDLGTIQDMWTEKLLLNGKNLGDA